MQQEERIVADTYLGFASAGGCMTAALIRRRVYDIIKQKMKIRCEMKKKSDSIKWYGLAAIAFSGVWGFGNVLNGFVYFNGIQVIFSWLFIFALYFVPYALMVGELGSAFPSLEGGVSSWIDSTVGPKVAYFAGWTYWVCHITYIASKASGGLKALSWAVFRNAETYDALPSLIVQPLTLVVLLLFCLIASRGINPLKKLASIAGTSMFVMSLLYILLMFAAPKINPAGDYVHVDFSFKKLLPDFGLGYFSSLSILIFAVGGVEKISPYVNKVEDSARGFPRGIIAMTVMIVVCAMLGTVAMGRMFDTAAVQADFNSYVANGAYWAFQKLGQYYHVGNALMILYALCNMIGQLSTLLVSIDAPLRMLLGSAHAGDYLPHALLRQNEYGAYTNGIKLVAVLSGGLILLQTLVPGAANVLAQLVKLNSVCMPFRYLWVFAAYLALRRSADRFPSEYRFVRNQHVARFFGIWCFVLTALSCLLGMYSEDRFTMLLNILTPIFLASLGVVMPLLAARERRKEMQS